MSALPHFRRHNMQPFLDPDDEDELSRDQPLNLTTYRPVHPFSMDGPSASIATPPATPDLSGSQAYDSRLARSASPALRHGSYPSNGSGIMNPLPSTPTLQAAPRLSLPPELSTDGSGTTTVVTEQCPLGQSVLNTKRKSSPTSSTSEVAKKAKSTSLDTVNLSPSQPPSPAPVAAMTVDQVMPTQSTPAPSKVDEEAMISRPMDGIASRVVDSIALFVEADLNMRRDSATGVAHPELENPLFVTSGIAPTKVEGVDTKKPVRSLKAQKLKKDANTSSTLGSREKAGQAKTLLSTDISDHNDNLDRRTEVLLQERIKDLEKAGKAERTLTTKKYETFVKARNKEAAEIRAVVEGLKGTVESEHDALVGYMVKVGDVEGEQTKLRIYMDELIQKVEQLEERINDFDDEQLAREKRTDDRLTGLELDARSMKEKGMRDEDAAAKIAHLQGEVERLTAQNAGMEVRMEKMEKFARSFPSF